MTRPAPPAADEAEEASETDAAGQAAEAAAAIQPDRAGARPVRPQRGIQSVEVGGRLLRALASARTPLALSDLALAAQIAPGQAHPYLVSLSKLGLIKRDDLSGRYEPGPLALRLGLLHVELQPAFRAAVPRVRALAESIGFSIAISLAGPQGPTIVRYERAGSPLHVNLHVGTVLSLPTTTTGRVFCAYLPDWQRDAMWARQSPGQPDLAAPGGTVAEFADLLAAIRARGLERSIDTPSPGISSLAAPVLNAAGELQLVLTAVGPTGTLDVSWDSAAARALSATAQGISATFAEADALGLESLTIL